MSRQLYFSSAQAFWKALAQQLPEVTSNKIQVKKVIILLLNVTFFFSSSLITLASFL
jgi:hypothetical protein